MMEVIQQLLVVVVLWMPDGSYKSTATPVNDCPNLAMFTGMMEARRNSGEIKSWVAYCTVGEFGINKEESA